MEQRKSFLRGFYSSVRNRRGVAISGGVGKGLKVNKRGGLQ